MNTTVQLIDRYRINVAKYGPSDAADSYLLVHGIGMSHRYFKPLAKELAKQSKVVAIDLPGFGNSDKPDDALDVSQQAEIINNFIRVEKLKNLTLVGQSMGCQFVLEAAISQPLEELKAIVLIGPTVNSHERYLSKQIGRLIQDTFRESFKANMHVIRDYFRSAKHHALTIRYMLSDSPEEKIKIVTVPVQIIRGSRDPIAPAYWIDELVAGSQLAVSGEVEGAPHLVQITHPRETARLIMKFKNRI